MNQLREENQLQDCRKSLLLDTVAILMALISLVVMAIFFLQGMKGTINLMIVIALFIESLIIIIFTVLAFLKMMAIARMNFL